MRDKTKYYTTQRVSKRLTIGEDSFQLARKSSERISLATQWTVHQVETIKKTIRKLISRVVIRKLEPLMSITSSTMALEDK